MRTGRVLELQSRCFVKHDLNISNSQKVRTTQNRSARESQVIVDPEAESALSISKTLLENINEEGKDQIYLNTNKNSYHMISSKRVEFDGRNAVAIHFQNVTQLVKTVQLESKILDQQIKVNALQNYASIMQHEFKTPIATSVSFLETILFL